MLGDFNPDHLHFGEPLAGGRRSGKGPTLGGMSLTEGILDRSASGASSPGIGRRTPAIDGIRALGALLVFGYHMWQFSGSPTLDLTIGPVQFDGMFIVAHATQGSTSLS